MPQTTSCRRGYAGRCTRGSGRCAAGRWDARAANATSTCTQPSATWSGAACTMMVCWQTNYGLLLLTPACRAWLHLRHDRRPRSFCTRCARPCRHHLQSCPARRRGACGRRRLSSTLGQTLGAAAWIKTVLESVEMCIASLQPRSLPFACNVFISPLAVSCAGGSRSTQQRQAAPSRPLKVGVACARGRVESGCR